MIYFISLEGHFYYYWYFSLIFHFPNDHGGLYLNNSDMFHSQVFVLIPNFQNGAEKFATPSSLLSAILLIIFSFIMH